MKKIFKILGAIVGVFVLLIVGGVVYLLAGFPKVGPAPQLTIERTPERIARGKYLANHVTVCMNCHSAQNFEYYSAPIVPGTEGKGGAEISEDLGAIYTYLRTLPPVKNAVEKYPKPELTKK